MRYALFVLLLLCLSVASFAKVQAVRTSSKIIIDGKLDEDIWKRQPFTELYQESPSEGSPATQRTEAWIAYDDTKIYVAARMYDTHPDSIVARMTRRDGWAEADFFWVEFDPYHDKRTGYSFGMSAAGSFTDATFSNDEWEDNTWDGIWDGKTQIDSLGWTAEFEIPFSQLRFHDVEEQIWGVNFARYFSRRKESDFAAFKPKNGSGYVSRFPELTGIKGIPSPSRIEFMPYTTIKEEFKPSIEGDPFHTGAKFSPGAGADLKAGVSRNLNLDMTFNPDFGQVEVDPAVINLSDAETIFQEKRPFFIEGSSVFRFGNGGANNFENYDWFDPIFFYSRRIGRQPQGEIPSADYSDIPIATTILGAAKLTGDLGNTFPIGAVSAVTKREYADLSTSGTTSEVEVEPLTYYNVLRLRKEYGGGFSALGGMVTNVTRSFDYPSLEKQLNKSGSVLAIDGWSFLDNNREWVVTGWAGLTHLSGTTHAITAIQQNSRHYFQRPDAEHIHVDTTATSLTGYGGRLWLNKQKGNVTLNAGLGYLDPNYDQNDLGVSFKGDLINAHIQSGYKWTVPSGIMHYASASGAMARSFDGEGNATHIGYAGFGNIQFTNYYQVAGQVSYFPWQMSNAATRGGPLMAVPRMLYSDLGFDSDPRKSVGFGASASYQPTVNGHVSWTTGAYIEWRASNNIFFRFAPSYVVGDRDAQYVSTVQDPTATNTFGSRYIFAELDQRTLSASIRFNWTFTPHLSFQLFLQPYISVGEYTNLKELSTPASYSFLRYGDEGSTISNADGMYTIDPDGGGSALPFSLYDPNFHFASIRGNAVLRWEYLPGSTAYLVWTQQQSAFSQSTSLDVANDLGDAFSSDNTENILMLKVSYWFSL